jgi:hypothetical protein
MKSCAFHPCADVPRCPLVGGCVARRFPEQQGRKSAVGGEQPKAKTEALNGTKPSRLRARTSTRR